MAAIPTLMIMYVVGVLRILRCLYFTSLPFTITVTMLTSSLSHLTSLHLISSHHTRVTTYITAALNLTGFTRKPKPRIDA
ncbi:hypothetical protein JMJ77_0003640, partial [Colletotrichum scovillei]